MFLLDLIDIRKSVPQCNVGCGLLQGEISSRFMFFTMYCERLIVMSTMMRQLSFDVIAHALFQCLTGEAGGEAFHQ